MLKFEERKKLFEKRLNPIINNDNKTSNNSNNFEIDVEPNNGKTDSDKNYIRAKKTCEFFYLKERISQEHSDYIAETIFKLIEYSKEYQEKICEDYQIDKEVFYRIIFGNYLEKTNINKRPLSKLSIDLKKQFEIFLIE